MIKISKWELEEYGNFQTLGPPGFLLNYAGIDVTIYS